MTDIVLEPLPWFAFHIAAYQTGTMRLTTESHGAYLLLMLDYYGKAAPCPDDDDILAAVTRLSLESWKRHRKVLAPLFDIRDGFWFHKKIQKEMLEACSKHAASIAKAQRAADARWDGNGPKPARPKVKRHVDTARPVSDAPSNAPSMLQASSEQSLEHTHLHKHSSITEERERALPPEVSQNGTGSGEPIPKDFLPDAEISDLAREAGMTVPEIDAEVHKFVLKMRAAGSKSFDWQSSFAMWIERGIAYRAKQAAHEAQREAHKAPARVEVNVSSPSERAAYVPSEADWDFQIKLWVTGGRWSFQTFGPEPGMGGCRVPRAILEKHGILKERAPV